MLHEEYEKAQVEKERLRGQTVDSAVAVREGDLSWMSELRSVLIDPAFLHRPHGVSLQEGLPRQILFIRIPR
ncbi:MAG: hypothetical protein MZV70_59730 [Desulfobacterales bacterium]|nr:hypothetical protein [Desulfobacterales bacterium]